MTRSRRVALRDRTWLRFHTVRAAGPLRVPPVDEVRRALRDLAAADPGHPLVCRLAGGRWHPVPPSGLEAHLAEVVVAAPAGVQGADAPGLARWLLADAEDGHADHLPFRVVLGEESAASRSAHALGDGSVTDGWFLALLTEPGAAGPLVRRDTGRRPLLAALRRSRRALRPAALRAAVAGPPARERTREVRVGVPALATATVPAAALAELRAHRDERLPGTSVATLLMSRTAAALARHDLRGDGVTVMMSCRRYLGEGAEVTGNFATGPWLDVDPSDPQALGSAVAAASTAGVPLTILGAVTARSLASRAPAGPARVAEPARPRITLSHLGRLPTDRLPWTDPTRASYVVAARPAGPEGVTVAFVPTPAGVEVSATAHPDVVDPDALAAALRELADRSLAVPA